MSSLAKKKFAESLDVTPDLAYAFIKVLKDWKIEFYIAPYEADAQLALLYITKRVSCVITEDSDLLVYGVNKCLFKMDCHGDGIFVDIENLGNVKELDFKNFSYDMLLTTCILSGCDYLESIKGIGFKTAHQLVQMNGCRIIDILQSIKYEGKYTIPCDYKINFQRALLTFKFQYVFCPDKRELINLNDPL